MVFKMCTAEAFQRTQIMVVWDRTGEERLALSLLTWVRESHLSMDLFVVSMDDFSTWKEDSTLNE